MVRFPGIAWRRTAVALGIAACVVGVVCWQRFWPARPNVLLITLDTTRADHLGSYGHAAALTPTLDALARSGVRLERAYATAPLTLPSHATMMTGLYPPEHGLRTNGKGRLAADVPTLARTLQKQGYRTGAFVGSFVLDSRFGLDQGFETYDDDLSGMARPHDELHRERPGNLVVDKALSWLGQNSGAPVFCWVHLYDPHFPYEPQAEDLARRFDKQPYDGEIAFVDRQVQRLVNFMTSGGRSSQTLVIVAGDHGEGLGEHQERTHGYMLYESTLRIPWMFSWPGQLPAGTVVRAPVSLVDLTPTVLECLHIAQPIGMTGRSLKPAFFGEPVTPSPCYAETDDPLLDRGWSGLRSFITPEWKFINTTIPELYRLTDDPGELRNLAQSEPRQRELLRGELADVEQRLVQRGTEQVALTAKEKRMLATLSYTAGQATPRPASDQPRADIKQMLVHQNRLEDALHLLAGGHLTAAEKLLRQVVGAVPDFYVAWGNLGLCLAEQGRFDEAVGCYQKVLTHDPDDMSALLNLAAARKAQNRIKEAEESLQQALQIEPDSADAWYALAGLSLHRGRAVEALSRYQQAVESDPEHAAAHRGLGDLLSEMGRLDESLEQYELSLKSDPQLVAALVNQGTVLARLGRLEAAANAFQAALKISPQDGLAHANLGRVLMQNKRIAEAIVHFNQAIETVPNDPLALMNLAWILATSKDAKLRDGARAVELARRGVKANAEKSARVWDVLAAACAETGQFTEAKTAISRAISLTPQRQSRTLQELRERQTEIHAGRPIREE